MTTSQETLILWAIDPFAHDLSLQKAAAVILKDLTRNTNVRIQPVYVEGFEAEFEQQILEEGRLRLDALTRRMKLKRLLPLVLVNHGNDSLREKTKELLAYAHRSGANLIVTSTHARKGPARWALGSFAETLSLQSDLPLLLVNPSWNRRSGLDRILFATDFSADSRRAFDELLPFARSLSSKLVVFHKADVAVSPAFEAIYQLLAKMEKTEEQDFARAQATGKEWVEAARKAGVPATLVIDRQKRKTLIQSLLAAADRAPGTIALAAESSSLESAILGSFARKVIRESKSPVWLLRPASR